MNVGRFVPVRSAQRGLGGANLCVSVCVCLFCSFGAARAGRCDSGRVWSSLICSPQAWTGQNALGSLMCIGRSLRQSSVWVVRSLWMSVS